MKWLQFMESLVDCFLNWYCREVADHPRETIGRVAAGAVEEDSEDEMWNRGGKFSWQVINYVFSAVF